MRTTLPPRLRITPSAQLQSKLPTILTRFNKLRERQDLPPLTRAEMITEIFSSHTGKPHAEGDANIVLVITGEDAIAAFEKEAAQEQLDYPKLLEQTIADYQRNYSLPEAA